MNVNSFQMEHFRSFTGLHPYVPVLQINIIFWFIMQLQTDLILILIKNYVYEFEITIQNEFLFGSLIKQLNMFLMKKWVKQLL